MKQLSKIMLAAVASVALAAPAFAWDFSASGSATAYFNQTSSKANNQATTKESTASNGSLLPEQHSGGFPEFCPIPYPIQTPG